MSITRLGTERRRMSKINIHNGTIYLCGQVAEDAEADISEAKAAKERIWPTRITTWAANRPPSSRTLK